MMDQHGALPPRQLRPRGKEDYRTERGHAPRWEKIVAIVEKVALVAVLLPALGLFVYLFPGFLAADWGEETVLVIGDLKAGEGMARAMEGEIYVRLETIKDHLDPHIHWDELEQTAVITTADRVIHMRSETVASEINLRPVDLEFPLLRDDEECLYLPLMFLSDFYGLRVQYFPGTDTVVIDPRDDGAMGAAVEGGAICLREGPSIRSPVLAVLGDGELLRVEKDRGEEWIRARTVQGLVGHVPRRYIRMESSYAAMLPGDMTATGKEGTVGDHGQPIPGKKMPESPFVMVWEYVYRKTDVEKIGEMPSLNIISPTWFNVRDEEGNVENLADPVYVKWARERGYDLWAAVTSSADPELTATVLSSSARRRKVIDQILIYARLYGLEGLNLDFENFHADYRDLYTQFVRELAPLCREEGLVLSVDVTMLSSSVYWSLCYDRAALAASADYVMLMAYDEHGGSSRVAGSVSSLPWVERGLQKVLQEVPAGKLVLGVPFYTRQWEIKYLEGGGQEVSSKAYSMGMIDEIVRRQGAASRWDSDALQNKVVYEEGEKTYEIWIEDADSMRQRAALVNKYGLAGIAAWRRGFETPEMWELIGTALGDR
ncbi:MAG: glycosyl hydrolase [Firmicutes bacterium]|jgi:spore germination protein YaaH|nr:glycosyl hydrolase [Bacillota bacterium]